MTARLRVCLISHVYLEKRYRGKLEHLGQSVDLTAISPDHFPFPYGTYRADFEDAQHYAVRVYPCRFPIGRRTSTRWVLESLDLGFARCPPDVIHVENEAHSFSLLQALLYRRLYAPRARVVVFVWANQRLAAGKRVGLDLLARLMRPRVDFFIAGNSEAKALLVQDGVAANRVAVFPVVGLDMHHYRPASGDDRIRVRTSLGIAPHDFVVGFVGRFVPEKGLEDLLQAFRALQARSGQGRVRLLCVGRGPLEGRLQAFHPDVLTASPAESSGVLPYYHTMDVLALPSRTAVHWKEQFGLVLAESMACGVPVVGSTSGAIPEVIGDAGLVVTEGNVEELVSRLWQLRQSPEQWAEFSARGLRRAADHYSDKRIAEQTLQVYDHLLRPARGTNLKLPTVGSIGR